MVIYRPLGGDNLRESNNSRMHAYVRACSLHEVIESRFKIFPYTRKLQTLRTHMQSSQRARARATLLADIMQFKYLSRGNFAYAAARCKSI